MNAKGLNACDYPCCYRRFEDYLPNEAGNEIKQLARETLRVVDCRCAKIEAQGAAGQL